MKIVLPGGSGQVGTILARAFHADGHEVVVLSRAPTPADGSGGLVLSARSMGRESCASADTAIVCGPALAEPGEERAGIDRIVDVSAGGTYRVSTRLRPRPGTALDAYLAALVDHVCGDAAPRWTDESGRTLTEPWVRNPFPHNAVIDQHIRASTPPAFARHGVYVDAADLASV